MDNEEQILATVHYSSFLNENGGINGDLLKKFADLCGNSFEVESDIWAQWLEATDIEGICKAYKGPNAVMEEFCELIETKTGLTEKDGLDTHSAVLLITDVLEEIYIREHDGKEPVGYPLVSPLGEILRERGLLPKKHNPHQKSFK